MHPSSHFLARLVDLRVQCSAIIHLVVYHHITVSLPVKEMNFITSINKYITLSLDTTYKKSKLFTTFLPNCSISDHVLKRLHKQNRRWSIPSFRASFVRHDKVFEVSWKSTVNRISHFCLYSCHDQRQTRVLERFVAFVPPYLRPNDFFPLNFIPILLPEQLSMLISQKSG